MAPPSDGAQPAPRVLPGVGPRRHAGPWGAGALSPWNAAAAAATSGPQGRCPLAGSPAIG
eukprot:8570743-Pyramimonas_sp.AAC.1